MKNKQKGKINFLRNKNCYKIYMLKEYTHTHTQIHIPPGEQTILRTCTENIQEFLLECHWIYRFVPGKLHVTHVSVHSWCPIKVRDPLFSSALFLLCLFLRYFILFAVLSWIFFYEIFQLITADTESHI